MPSSDGIWKASARGVCCGPAVPVDWIARVCRVEVFTDDTKEDRRQTIVGYRTRRSALGGSMPASIAGPLIVARAPSPWHSTSGAVLVLLAEAPLLKR